MQTAVTLVNLAARRLDEGDRDQARLAIEGVRALLPLCPDEVQSALRDPLAQLQLAWARPGSDREGKEAPAEAADATPPRERADARPQPESRLWTPPGST